MKLNNKSSCVAPTVISVSLKDIKMTSQLVLGSTNWLNVLKKLLHFAGKICKMKEMQTNSCWLGCHVAGLLISTSPLHPTCQVPHFTSLLHRHGPAKKTHSVEFIRKSPTGWVCRFCVIVTAWTARAGNVGLPHTQIFAKGFWNRARICFHFLSFHTFKLSGVHTW